MADRATPKKDEVGAQFTMALEGRKLIESLGEMFILDRFASNCQHPNAEISAAFSTALIERFTRETFPRILLYPGAINPKALDVKALKADLQYLTKLVDENPGGFMDLASSLDDPDRFRRIAETMKLTEGDFVAAGGGWLLWVVAVVAALVLTGCPGSGGGGAAGCPSVGNPTDQWGTQHPGTKCTNPVNGHSGPHNSGQMLW